MLRDVEIYEALRLDDLAYILTVRFEKPLLDLPKEDTPPGLMKQMTLVQAAAYFRAEKCFTYFFKRMKKVNISSDQIHLIHFAAAGGNINIISSILNRMDVINKQDADRNTPLHYAVNDNNFEVARYLLDCHANPNAQNSEGISPAHVAAINGNVAILRLLYDSGSSLKQINCMGWFPIFYAVKYGHSDAALFLVQKQCFDPSIESFFSLAQLATSYGMNDVVRTLINLGINTFQPNHNYWTIIHSAAASGNTELFIHMYNAFGPEPFYQTDRLQRNAAHIAAINGQLEIIKAIEGIGINMFNSKDKYGMTPFMLAVDCSNRHIIDYLMPKSDLSVTDKNGRTLLHIAVENNDIPLTGLFLENNFDPNVLDNKGRTPLFCAVEKSLRNPIVVLLLQHGCDPNIKPFDGNTIISCSVVKAPHLLQVLLAAGADIVATNSKGWNCLHFAAISSSISVFDQLLADQSAKPLLNQTTNNGETPFYLACMNGKTSIVINLLTKMAKILQKVTPDEGIDFRFINQADKKGNSPLMAAIQRGYSDIASNLLNNSEIDLNIQNDEGKTAFHIAVESWMNKTSIDISNITKVFVNMRDNQGLSPFLLASKLGNCELVAVLVTNPRIRCDLISNEGMNAANYAAHSMNRNLLMILKYSMRVDMTRKHFGVAPIDIIAAEQHVYSDEEEEPYEIKAVSDYSIYEEEEEFMYSDTEDSDPQNADVPDAMPMWLQNGDVFISRTRDNLFDNQENMK